MSGCDHATVPAIHGTPDPGPRTPDARALLAHAQAVCFDVDSTVIQDEGIDVLAAFAGVGEQVAAMTANAMGGSLPFEVALARRLDLIRPSRDLLARCLAAHPPRLTPGIRDLIQTLQARGTTVWLVSGGFRAMIEPVADAVGVSRDRIIANVIRFDDVGNYRDFDPDQPTSRSGGKAKALGDLKARFGYAPLLMVGDGATDLEARPPADAFIGFGGVVVREKVKAGADWFVTSAQELRDVLV